MIKQHIYHFFWSLFCLKDWFVIYNLMLCIECIEFMMLLYTFLVISSARYKEYMICLISFITFSDVLLAFTCAGAIGNLWRICLKVNILSLSPFCWLLKLRSFSAIPIILFGFTFGFSGTSARFYLFRCIKWW